MTQVVEEILVADPNLDPETWVDQYGDYLYRFALARIKDQAMDKFFKCLAELPQRLSKVFMLREMEGYSTKEVCNALQVSATNSWVMLYRARMFLRRCLELFWFNKTKEENK